MEWVVSAAITYWNAFLDWVVWGYGQSPEVMMGLAAVLVMPPLAIVGLLIRGNGSGHRRVSVHAPVPPTVPHWRRKFALEFVGQEAPPLEIGKDLIRIGRETDNEICIRDNTVHRYHAAIEKSSDRGPLIHDLSGEAGNGVHVNGKRVSSSRLSDGDEILLGKVHLRFCVTIVEDQFYATTVSEMA